jgi:uncharacterized short protein YbdD (DUF466 family)
VSSGRAGGAAAAAPAVRAAAAVRAACGRAVRAVRWYLREVSGDSAYERHCAHLRRTAPDAAVPSRREFQRLRARRLEEAPLSRCC